MPPRPVRQYKCATKSAHNYHGGIQTTKTKRKRRESKKYKITHMQTATSGFTNVEQFNISSACFCWLALVIYLLCAYYYLVNTMLHGIQVIVIVLCPLFLISYIPSAKLNFFDGIRIYAAHLLGWVCVCCCW